MYEAVIKRHDGKGSTVPVANLNHADSYEMVRWLREQIKWLHKEPYMAPRFEGEEPLEGLG